MRARSVAFALVSICAVAVVAAVFISSAGRGSDSGPAPTAVAAIRVGDLLAVGLDPYQRTSERPHD